MLEFLYLNGWGPFLVTLIFFVPFLIVFYYVVSKKSKDHDNNADKSKKFTKIETAWLGLVFVLFIGFNIVSIGFMPTVQTARASNQEDIQQVDITATSWAFAMSSNTVEAGKPVRFSGKSTDTMHSFALYAPDGDVLFTMMLMPGFEPSGIIHTIDEPGTYTVRCLEFCGIGHHQMKNTLTVVAADTSEAKAN